MPLTSPVTLPGPTLPGPALPGPALPRPATAPEGSLRRAVVVDASGSATSPAAALAEHLARRDADVQLLDGTAPDGALPDRTLPDRTLPDGAAGVRGRRVDLVVAVTGPDGDPGAACRLAEETRARLVVVLLGLAHLPDAEVVRRLAAADRIAIPGEPFRRALTARGIDDRRISLLPAWAHAAPADLDRSDARSRLGWPARGFIVVHAGPLDGVHDPDDAVAAARLLGPDCLVVLIGDGPGRPAVEAAAAGVAGLRVCPLPDDQASLASVAADVFLVTQPSDAALLAPPREVADHLAAGRPVVAAVPVAGAVAAELSRSGGAGLVVPPGEPARLAGALLALHADPAHRVVMSLAGIAYAEAQLSRDAVLARFDRIVDATMAQPPVTVRLG